MCGENKKVVKTSHFQEPDESPQQRGGTEGKQILIIISHDLPKNFLIFVSTNKLILLLIRIIIELSFAQSPPLPIHVFQECTYAAKNPPLYER